VYPNLAHLLYDKHLTEEQLTDIAQLLVSEKYLHFDIENYIELSVLTRSFTILQLAIIVFVHQRDNIIEQSVIEDLYDKFLDYFDQEENYLGYKEDIGWLHSIAHSADLFAQLMKVDWFTETQLKTMFKAISKKFKTKSFFFMYDEDERMIHAIMNGLERDLLDKEFIVNWVEDLGSYKKISEFPEAYYLTNNIKILLRSLYFRILDNEKYGYLEDKIKEVLKDKVKIR
jgi:hypothetical protein